MNTESYFAGSRAIYSLLLLTLFVLLGCAASAPDDVATTGESNEDSAQLEIQKSEEDWRRELTDEQHYVLREHGTEPRWDNAYVDEHRDGIYHCAGCGLELFSSDHKYDSRTGWPSYYQPLDPNNIGTEIDRRGWRPRTEVHCSRCGGHLGHVFTDGPEPTGLRYCMNSAAMEFSPSNEDQDHENE